MFRNESNSHLQEDADEREIIEMMNKRHNDDEDSEDYDEFDAEAMKRKQNVSSTDNATKDDLMFSTEVDTAGMDFSRNKVNSMADLNGKASQLTYDNVASTKMSDVGNLSLP